MATATETQPAAAGVSGQPASPAGADRIAILAGEMESFGVRLTVLETRIGEIGQELRDGMERDRAQMERSLRDLIFQTERLRTRMDETDTSFRKVNEAVLQANTMVETLIQHLIAVQRDVSVLQSHQKELKASLEKEIAEGKAASIAQADALMTGREKVFIEEIARQAAAVAKAQEAAKADLDRLRLQVEARIADAEKALSSYTDKKVAPLLAEAVRHESRISGMEQKLAAAMRQADASLSAAVDRLYRDIESQIQQKFKVILDELVRQEESVAGLAREMASLRSEVSGRPRGGDLAAMLQQEEEDLKKEYQRQLDRRLAFYARLKDLLQEVAATESRIAALESRISSTAVETGVAAGRYLFYVVKKGDTLWAIAQRYGTTTKTLRHLNGLGPAEMLYAGQTLKVPAASP